MGDVSVDRGATAKLGQVEGDLRVGQAARIEPEDKVIHVTGRVSCDGDAEFHGSLSCSEFSARHGKIRIEGDLIAKSEVKVDDGQLAIDGSLEAATVTVDKALRIGGNARANDFDVGGVLEVRGTISGKKVDVGGSFKVQGTAEVEEVDVGGTVDIASIVKFAKLDVGGMARIGGGEVSKDVDVGGKFESTKPLKFSKIDVGGLAILVEGGEGGDVDVGGKFESRADLSFNSLDVGGMASINGNGKGVEVDVGGLLRVSGSLTLEKDLDIGGGPDHRPEKYRGGRRPQDHQGNKRRHCRARTWITGERTHCRTRSERRTRWQSRGRLCGHVRNGTRVKSAEPLFQRRRH